MRFFWRVVLGIILVLFLLPSPSYGVDSLDFYTIQSYGIEPIPCGTSESRSCPKEMLPVYEKLGEPCARSFEEFSNFPTTRHYWIEDPATTAQGKANERARQFIYWAVNKEAIDSKPVLSEIWLLTTSVALFFVVLVAALFGIGIIISRKTNFQLNLALWPTLIKIGVMLLYIALSLSLVLLFIQLSEIIMRFFIENLGGRDLFNIYFTNSGNLGSSERNYTDFVGCRDLNIRVQESVDTKFFLYQLTNITYYVMGIMIILRKVLLWFLLFVSPFLALLMPFIFIRNIGWIWIGVFFQWLMYGPLFALFLGALSRIWKAGIPWNFDFSRIVPTGQFNSVSNPLRGYTYPTSMNILYGGPAQVGEQSLSAINSGNYVDTFAEYVITLIMLWAVTFFPWWLLRIFRDYCCDGVYATRNVLFAMYDHMRGGSPNGPHGSPGPGRLPGLGNMFAMPNSVGKDIGREISREISRNAGRDISREVTRDMTDRVGREVSRDVSSTMNSQVERTADRAAERAVHINLESIADVRQAATSDITRSLDMHARSLTDIARMETNSSAMSQMQQNLRSLSNPATASNSTDRQKFMNLRTELFNRSIKKDAQARAMLASTSASSYERLKARESLMKSIQEVNTHSAVSSLSNRITTRMMGNMSGGLSGAISASLSGRLSGSLSGGAGASISGTGGGNTSHSRSTVVSLDRSSLQQIAQASNKSVKEVRQSIEKLTSTTEVSNRAVSRIAKTTNMSETKSRELVSAFHQMQTQMNAGGKSGMLSDSDTRKIAQALESSTTKIAQEFKSMSREQKNEIIKAFRDASRHSSVEFARALSKELGTSTEILKSVIKSSIHAQTKAITNTYKKYMGKLDSSTRMVSRASQKTGLAKSDVEAVMRAFSANMDKPANQIINNISKITNISQSNVKSVLGQMSSSFYAKNLVLDFAEQQEVDKETLEEAIRNTIQSIERGGSTGGDGGDGGPSPDSPDAGGPGGGGGPGGEPEHAKADHEEELEHATHLPPDMETTEIGTGGPDGPPSEPTHQQLQLARKLVNAALGDETFVTQNNIVFPEDPDGERMILEQVLKTISESSAAVDEVVSDLEPGGGPEDHAETGTPAESPGKTPAEEGDKELEETADKTPEDAPVTARDMTKILLDQIRLAADPEDNIDQIIDLPKSISMEEYEELRDMWEGQYASGDIPLGPDVTSRDEWVEQDIVTITNIMNKILSGDENLQQQGFDELGFIIPVFMINNLEGEELITYLKAKLEAAKTVRDNLAAEADEKARLEAEQEEEDDKVLVPIRRPVSARKKKYLTMDLPETQRDLTIEELGERVKEAEKDDRLGERDE